MNPSGSVRVVAPISFGVDIAIGAEESTFLVGEVLPDYGQANLPASTVADWKLPTVKDASGLGMPIGKAANLAYWNQAGAPRDGFVNFDAAGNMIGNYDY